MTPWLGLPEQLSVVVRTGLYSVNRADPERALGVMRRLDPWVGNLYRLSPGMGYTDHDILVSIRQGGPYES